MGTLTLVKSDDGEWEGLYFNNMLVVEGDSVTAEEVLGVVHNYLCVTTDTICVQNQWMEDEAYLPKDMRDIPQEAIIK